jgi:endopolyphosphatase
MWLGGGEVQHREWVMPDCNAFLIPSPMFRDCDAPMSLVNLTFAWLQKEWANEVDFVVCECQDAINSQMMAVDAPSFGTSKGPATTQGKLNVWPSAICRAHSYRIRRHDIDREIPRTPKEIYELNRMMAGKMKETFGEDVVVVPSIGT